MKPENFRITRLLRVVAVLGILGTQDSLAVGRSKTYDLTCSLKLGEALAQAVKTVRVASQPVTVSGGTGFGSYSVTARRHHIYATVTEKATGASNQFVGEIEIHDDGEPEHEGTHPAEPNGFVLTANPSSTGSEQVTLSCQGKRLLSELDVSELES